MKRARGSAAVALLLSAGIPLVYLGCGDDTNVNVAQPPSPGEPGQPGDVPTEVTLNVTQVFNSNPIIIKQQNVTNIATWTIINNVQENHWIIANNGTFNTGIIAPGAQVTVRVNRPGSYSYRCGVHPGESGTLQVQAADDSSPSPSPSPSPSISASPSPSPTASPSVSPSPSPTSSPPSTDDADIVITPGASNRTDDAFANGPIVIREGSVLRIVNTDSEDHTVTADDGSFNSGIIPPGEAAELVINQPGEFPFHCEIHPEMRGVLRVEAITQPSPSPSPSSPVTPSPTVTSFPTPIPSFEEIETEDPFPFPTPTFDD